MPKEIGLNFICNLGESYMEKQGMVSIWLGNVNSLDQLEEYIKNTYDEKGESVPSRFFVDFNIDMDETDEDLIEKGILEEKSDKFYELLEGCSYIEAILHNMNKSINLTKAYNAIILIYNFEYDNYVGKSGQFEYIISTSYLK